MTRLRSSLGLRIVAVAILCGTVGVLSTISFGRATVRDIVRSVVARVVFDAFRDASRAACLAAPATWHYQDRAGDVGFAYDAETGRSQNPLAPPLDRALAAEAERAPDGIAVSASWSSLGGTFVFHAARAGECAIVQGTWVRPVAGRQVMRLLAIALAVGGFAGGLGFLLVVRPLTKRIHRVRAVAERIGAPDAPSLDTGDGDRDDELGIIEDGMVRAHTRILEDTRRLAERHRALERHLADVAHDLRTPLSSLQLALERLAHAELAEGDKRTLDSALRDVVYLAELGANLRLASRLDDGWAPTEEAASADLTEVVLRNVERFRFLASRRGISVEVAVPDDPVFVRCAYFAMERVVSNVVENAVNYNEDGGHVAVSLREIAGAGFVLEVLDDGHGVRASEVPRLVERAYRSAEARAQNPRGAGLGLAIVSEICARCDFELTLEPVTPQGTRVVIRGPVQPRQSVSR
jgi:signal transduction histidine kinase